MKYLQICGIAFLSLGLMGSACREAKSKSQQPMQSPPPSETIAPPIDESSEPPIEVIPTQPNPENRDEPAPTPIEVIPSPGEVAPIDTMPTPPGSIDPRPTQPEPAPIEPNPTPVVIEPQPEPVDDTDAVKITLAPSAYRVIQGKPLAFERFDRGRDLTAISSIEMERSEYLKIQNDDEKNIIVEIDFKLPSVSMDALLIHTQMHSDTSGQFRAGRNIKIVTQDTAEPVKWLDRLAGSEPGLGNKDLYFSTSLRKNLARYVLSQGEQNIIRLIIELDYSALSRCRVLGVIPCWERPALFLDFVGLELLQTPER